MDPMIVRCWAAAWDGVWTACKLQGFLLRVWMQVFMPFVVQFVLSVASKRVFLRNSLKIS